VEAEAKSAVPVGPGGVDRSLRILTHAVEDDPNSGERNGVAIQDAAGGASLGGKGRKSGKGGEHCKSEKDRNDHPPRSTD
jgi:hypothetical protein